MRVVSVWNLKPLWVRMHMMTLSLWRGMNITTVSISELVIESHVDPDGGVDSHELRSEKGLMIWAHFSCDLQ